MKEVNIRNKRASYDYEFIDTLVTGIVLTGTEIKSIRMGKASVNESYCAVTNDELWVYNMDISKYADGSYNNHDPKRVRKLLLKKSELKKWDSKLKNKGLTVIPVKLFINASGLAKLKIALAKGKKVFDKRDSIKEKDLKRDMDRIKVSRY